MDSVHFIIVQSDVPIYEVKGVINNDLAKLLDKLYDKSVIQNYFKLKIINEENNND